MSGDSTLRVLRVGKESETDPALGILIDTCGGGGVHFCEIQHAVAAAKMAASNVRVERNGLLGG